jgi:hypothetical protein
MYLVELKTLLTRSMRQVFDATYPNAQFRNLRIGIEYPNARTDYPGIWVDFEPTGDIEIANRKEYSVDPVSGTSRMNMRWYYKGYATYTLVALTSLERDLLFDEVTSVFAFDKVSDEAAKFRASIESNDLIAANFDFDKIGQRGFAANPGTPWGTDEVVYEVTVAMGCFGEFISDPGSATLVPLSAVKVFEWNDQQTDPTLGPPESLDPTEWWPPTP